MIVPMLILLCFVPLGVGLPIAYFLWNRYQLGQDMREQRRGLPVGERRQERLDLMQAMFEGAPPGEGIRQAALLADLGWSPYVLSEVIDHLGQRGLVEPVTDRGLLGTLLLGRDTVRLTPEGIDLIEGVLRGDLPAEAVGLVIHAPVVGSAINVGSPGAYQDVHPDISANDLALLGEFVACIREALDSVDARSIPEDERAQARADAITIEAQVGVARPNRPALRAAFERLAQFAVSFSGSAAFAGAVEVARHIRL